MPIKTRIKRQLLLGWLLTPISLLVADDEKKTFFESKIRPVLAEKCYDCHSGQSQKVKGGLRLDHISLIKKGGDTGSAIEAIDGLEPLLLEALSYENPDMQMPPKEKLPSSVLADFKRWIEGGAYWPEEAVPDVGASVARSSFDLEKRRKEHWCWQPILKAKLPSPSSKAIIRKPLDAFIQAALGERGIAPAEPADRRTWIRRVYFDLIGLPPSTDQIAAFLEDSAPDAFEKVVDELLKSPHFGEKWARHWMDLVRYAETCGHEFDYPLEHPHEYRDYLIRAFNADLPYDQLLIEHVAGDLLEKPRRHPKDQFNESIIGTGYWYFHEAVHAPTDPKQDNADRIENQLDVFGKTFLGLTIGCARCHDHKFDAISDEDYYSLAAYLQGSTRQEYPLDLGRKREEARSEISTLAGKLLDEIKSDAALGLDAFKPSAYIGAVDELFEALGNRAALPGAKEVEALAGEKGLDSKILLEWCRNLSGKAKLGQWNQKFPKEAKGWKDRILHEENFIKSTRKLADFSTPLLPDGWKVTGYSFPSRKEGFLSPNFTSFIPSPDRFGSIVLPGRFSGNLRSPLYTLEEDRIYLRIRGEKVFVRLVIDNFHMAKYNSLLFRGTLHKNYSSKGQLSWLSVSGLNKYKGHKGYLEILGKGDAFIEIEQVRAGSIGAPGAHEFHPLRAVLSKGIGPEDSLAENLDEVFADFVGGFKKGKYSQEQADLVNWLEQRKLVHWGEGNARVSEFRKKAQGIEKSLPGERYATTMGKGVDYKGYVYVRGSHRNKGVPVASRNLTALGSEGGDRLALAKDLVEKDNPLTSRVMVNRIWHYMFGRGIVPTTDDFGPMGQPPSNPLLLDWLSRDFVRNNWSVKGMVREIALSHTYRQSSKPHPSNSVAKIKELDPNNVGLYRMPVRRITSEAIRDSLLAHSGRLDRKMFGSSVAVHRTAFMTGRGGRGSGPADGAGRRSVYGSVYRNFLSPFMLAFDQPAPFGTKGRRTVSNVPAQSLALLNDPFVVDQCKLWGKKVHHLKLPVEEKISRMYEQAFGSLPEPDKVALFRAFMDRQTTLHGNMDERVWGDLAHVFVNTKNFIYLK